MKDKHEPVKWLDLPPLNAIRAIAEQKTIVEIKDLNPFEYKKNEFIVTVTIKKIDGPWWYNACDKCKRTAKPYGYLYRCFGDDCPPTVPASPRFKLSLIAGDQTSDTKFILFGRMAQKLIGKSVDILLDDNPAGEEFMPKEIAGLLEKEFTFNASARHPILAMSSATSEGFSIGQESIPDTPSAGISGPMVTPTKGIDVISECSSKKGETKASAIVKDEEDNATLATLKAAGLGAAQSTSKGTKKRTRASPGSTAARKLFRNDNDEQQETGAQEST
ncbi:uncharacterized protein LOC127771505 isoform X2 [Oryza glaberrima]|uniref:uncharacterized protein LOC127771505 isoform X2 n=1 Tax=Oryza glaberrima TaxID=4538 RepID=UPI00224C16F5|nr:uncharacterized protein LOC127771505 isoform X2 [Oryza glaberrima]